MIDPITPCAAPGCPHPAAWELVTSAEPRVAVPCCTAHVGLFLTEAAEHRLYHVGTLDISGVPVALIDAGRVER